MGAREVKEAVAALKARQVDIPKLKPFQRHKYQRKSKWDAVAIPKRVAEIRAAFDIKSLGDLLLLLGVPWSTAYQWAAGHTEHTIRNPLYRHYQIIGPQPTTKKNGKPNGRKRGPCPELLTRPAAAPHPEWLEACRGVPIPPWHELRFLRYCTRPTIDAYQARYQELFDCEASGQRAHDTASAEVIEAAWRAGVRHRSERRKLKFGGNDPIEEALAWDDRMHGLEPRTAEQAIMGDVKRDWQELSKEFRKRRSKMTEAEKRAAYLPPTMKPYAKWKPRRSASKAKRVAAYWTATKLFEANLKKKTDDAFMKLLGYVPDYKPRVTKRLTETEEWRNARLADPLADAPKLFVPPTIPAMEIEGPNDGGGDDGDNRLQVSTRVYTKKKGRWNAGG